MADQPLLSARGLCKSFGAVRVIHEVSFDVRPNEVLGILGPNGAGKTTLFNLISGDARPDAGELQLAGISLANASPAERCKRGIGRTYQIPQPFSGMNTFENLLVPAMFGAGRSERTAYDHCSQILEDCGLADKSNVLAGSLTLLDRKRLELARALAGEPKLLLLDEIAGGLTEDESSALVDLIRRVRVRNITVVWIEHVLHAIMAIADRMMVLNFGEKIAEGLPKDVMSAPDVQRVYMGIEV